MMQEICKYPNGTYLELKWANDSLSLGGVIDTIYESDNGLDEKDDGYKEFYCCAFRIKRIDKNTTNMRYEINDLIELSIENQPVFITLKDGKVIYENPK